MNQNKSPDMQERFKEIIKDSLSPLMKKHKFRKYGNKYKLVGDKLTYIVTIYKSRYNIEGCLDFRLEWGIALNDDQKRPEILFLTEALYGNHRDLMPDPYPSFFKLKETDSETLDADLKVTISNIVETKIFPFIFSFKSTNDIIKILENTPVKQARWGTPAPGQTLKWLAILYFFIYKPETSVKLLDQAMQETKIEAAKENSKMLKEKIAKTMR